MDAQTNIKNATIEAVIVKADGTRVPLGVIAEVKPEKEKVPFFKKILGGK